MRASNTKVRIKGKFGEFLGITGDDLFKFIDCDGFLYNLTAQELTQVDIIEKCLSERAEDMSRHMDLLCGKFNGKLLSIDQGLKTLLGLPLHQLSNQ